MSALEKMQIQQELALLEELDRHKREVDAELGRQCLREPWGKQAMKLLQLSGFGVVMTMIVLSVIGDIRRFESSRPRARTVRRTHGTRDSWIEKKRHNQTDKILLIT